ncbi:hypothetical protein D7X30_22620 [Corallococcus sp. AB011P]|uniref:hypothetical protein n=1 Tax=Corallococcus sp. AB011P TaxID=2316735 RepID=UPI000EA20DE1|nr:hypothetical protein [Corallococcus sp. AB011P]RKG56378.1 hypothetical protein D7X30_22620 [Corallococcus sp. AB011P]
MSEQSVQPRYRALLADVEQWAKGFGGRLVLGPPVSEEDLELLPELLGGPPPAGGSALAPGLREFWRLHAFARVEVPRAEEGEQAVWTALPANFRVYSPDEVLESLALVRIPSGVTLDNRPITTSHLVPFAAAYLLPRDIQWCIATSGGDLKAPTLVLNHMGELAWACFQDTRRFVWEQRGHAPSHVFDTFLDWFESYVRDIRALAPERLYPDGVHPT